MLLHEEEKKRLEGMLKDLSKRSIFSERSILIESVNNVKLKPAGGQYEARCRCIYP